MLKLNGRDIETVLANVRPNITILHAYVGGIQPDNYAEWVKVNQNEFPYPPAPRVLQVLKEFSDSGLVNRYPPGDYKKLKEALAAYHGISRILPNQITVGNGSDEVLQNIALTLLDSGNHVAFPYPDYLMFSIISDLQNAKYEEVDSNPDFTIPIDELLKRRAKLTLVSNPNTPSGVLTHISEISRLIEGLYPNIVVVDEAYSDFASDDAIKLLGEYPNLLMTRTFSKVRGIARLRFGYGMGHKDIIGRIEALRLPYNINGAAEVATLAALETESVEYEMNMVKRIKEDRVWLTQKLTELGFKVYPSEANFVFAEHVPEIAKKLYEGLKERKALVRYFGEKRRLEGGIRITVGTTEENRKLLSMTEELLKSI